ncbi:MAG: cytochrome c oxidase subunit II [Candidatus Obscuribacterales bacterium]|nr:cytochrome c oxidase subunit II [Steroidobacteraceae bacterium]
MKGNANQSTLHAAQGSSAELIHELGMALYIGGALIFLLVIALTIYGVAAGPQRINVRRWIIGGGLAFPVVTLIALLVYSVSVSNALHTHTPDDSLRVHITAKQWWWEVRYERSDTDSVVLANELHIPIGQPVELILTTSDVIHSFWVPALAGKVDMIPGRSNRLIIKTQEAGVYRGQCAEFCGLQHALMAFYVIAEPEAQFNNWLARQAEPIHIAEDLSQEDGLPSGHDLFFSGGCAACHTIRGTAAIATLGPDLTHIGSRHSLAAGILRNHIGTMAGWIAAAQDVKPGNAMPSTNVHTGQELRTLAAWLENLE